MTKINLREQYPDFYKTDYIIEVPDEVAAVMKEHDRLEAAYRRRTYYHKAHYSLDRGDGIEYDALFVSMTPCELYERKGRWSSFTLRLPLCRTSRPSASMLTTSWD